MKKHTKISMRGSVQFLTLISILILALTLSACGSGSEGNQTEKGKTDTKERRDTRSRTDNEAKTETQDRSQSRGQSEVGGRSEAGGRSAASSSKEISVVTKTIQLSDVTEYATISGKIEGISDISIIAEVSGKVISISKKLGDYVKAGEEIAKIDNEDIELQLAQAKASSLAAKANYESEEIKFQINEELYEKQSISEVEYILAKSSFETAKAAYDGAMANQKLAERELGNSLFTAPVSGRIATLPIKVGGYLSIGTEVASIVDDSQIVIKTGAGPSLIQKLEKNDLVELTTKLSHTAFTGKISGIGLKPGSDSFNYPIEIEAENNLNLLSGQLVSGKIAVNQYEDVLTVNPSSVVDYYGIKVVYVVDSENLVHKREIDILAEVSETCIVKSGLQIGESVIIQGMDQVKEGSLVVAKNSDSNNDLALMGE